MSRVFAWAFGLALAALGAFLAIRGALVHTPSIAVISVGVGLVLLGGYVIPNTAFADGSKRFLVVVQPLLPTMFGGRRFTDPQPDPQSKGD